MQQKLEMEKIYDPLNLYAKKICSTMRDAPGEQDILREAANWHGDISSHQTSSTCYDLVWKHDPTMGGAG